MRTNEAAERLLYALADEGEPDQWDKRIGLIDAALADERRATVERIRHDVLFARGSKGQPTQTIRVTDLVAILDEEAARDG